MQSHIQQGLQNQKFISDCHKSYPNNHFDWKVTASFYTALHLLQAFCIKRRIYPPRTHQDIKRSFDPRLTNNNPVTPFPAHVWKWYNSLQIYSECARYDGFLDCGNENELQRDNFKEAQLLLHNIKEYFSKNGVICDTETAA